MFNFWLHFIFLHSSEMTTKNSILVWWTSRVFLSQRGTTICRCQEKLSSMFMLWLRQISHARRKRYFNVVDTIVDPRIYALQDSPGTKLPCWYG